LDNFVDLLQQYQNLSCGDKISAKPSIILSIFDEITDRITKIVHTSQETLDKDDFLTTMMIQFQNPPEIRSLENEAIEVKKPKEIFLKSLGWNESGSSEVMQQNSRDYLVATITKPADDVWKFRCEVLDLKIGKSIRTVQLEDRP